MSSAIMCVKTFTWREEGRWSYSHPRYPVIIAKEKTQQRRVSLYSYSCKGLM